MVIKPSIHPEVYPAVCKFYEMACHKYPEIFRRDPKVVWHFALEYVRAEMQVETSILLQDILGGGING